MVARPSPGSQITGRAYNAGSALLAAYLCLYAAALLTMNRAWNFDVAEPLLVLGILGVGFSLIAWLLTVNTSPLDYRVADPAS